jgi:hypothetical protein
VQELIKKNINLTIFNSTFNQNHVLCEMCNGGAIYIEDIGTSVLLVNELDLFHVYNIDSS